MKYLLVIMLFVWGCETPTELTSNDEDGAIPNAPAIYRLTPLGSEPDRGMYVEIWDDSDNESGFVIQRKAQGGSFVQIVALPANTGTYTDWGLEMSVEYTYRIKAYNSFGSSAWDERTKTSAGLGEGEIFLYPTADSYVDKGFPATNFNVSTYLLVEDPYSIPAEETISFIKFPVLQNLPSYALGIKFAEMVMFSQDCSPVGGPLVDTRRVLSNWSEYTITWDNQPSFSWSAEGLGTVVNNDGELVYFEITTLVYDWFKKFIPNYGVALCTDNSIKGAILFPRETPLCPWLDIIYYW